MKSKVQPNSQIYTFADEDGISAWFGLHLDRDAKAAVEKYEGIESIENDPVKRYLGTSPAHDDADTPESVQLSEPPSGLQRRDQRHPLHEMYIAFPKAGSDTKKTKAFLKSKVKPDTCLFTSKKGHDESDVVAWTGLHLDPDAKAEVQAYEGIVSIRDSMIKRREVLARFDVSAIKTLEPVKPRRPHRHETYRRLPRSDPRHPLHRIYTACAEASTTTQATEVFLKPQLRPGTELSQVIDDDDIIGWYALDLSPEAKLAVENHPGIVEIKDELEINQTQIYAPTSTKFKTLEPVHPQPQANKGRGRREGMYTAFAQENTDTTATEEFFNTYIKPGT